MSNVEYSTEGSMTQIKCGDWKISVETERLGEVVCDGDLIFLEDLKENCFIGHAANLDRLGLCSYGKTLCEAKERLLRLMEQHEEGDEFVMPQYPPDSVLSFAVPDDIRTN